jgi:hypothetical protein
VGVSTWGLVESIDATNNTVTNFWGIVDDIAARVDNATRGFQDLERDLLPLSGNLSVLTVNAQGLLDAVKSSSLNSNQQVSQTLDQAQTLLDTLDAVPQAVSQILATVKDAINMLRDNFRDVGGGGLACCLGLPLPACLPACRGQLPACCLLAQGATCLVGQRAPWSGKQG